MKFYPKLGSFQKKKTEGRFAISGGKFIHQNVSTANITTFPNVGWSVVTLNQRRENHGPRASDVRPAGSIGNLHCSPTRGAFRNKKENGLQK